MPSAAHRRRQLVPVPAHLEDFLSQNFNAWTIFDARYLRDPDQTPPGYEAGSEPIERYAMGRLSRANVRCAIIAFAPMDDDTAERAIRVGIAVKTERECKRKALACLAGLQNLTEQQATSTRCAPAA